MWTNLKIHTKTRPSGRLWFYAEFSRSGHVSDTEVVAAATERYTNDKLMNNSFILDCIAKGDYIIERTPS